MIKAEIGEDGKCYYWDIETGEAWTLKEDANCVEDEVKG